MPVTAKCQNCLSKFSAPDRAAGKRKKCPKCGNMVVFPGSESGVRTESVTAPPVPPVRKPAPNDTEPESSILERLRQLPRLSRTAIAIVVVLFIMAIGWLSGGKLQRQPKADESVIAEIQVPSLRRELPRRFGERLEIAKENQGKEQPTVEATKKDKLKEPFPLEAKKVVVKEEPPKPINVMDLHKEFRADKAAFRQKWNNKPVFAYGMVSQVDFNNSGDTWFICAKTLHSYNTREVQDRIWFMFTTKKTRGTTFLFPGFESQLTADGKITMPFGVGSLVKVEGIIFTNEPASPDKDIVDISIAVTDLK